MERDVNKFLPDDFGGSISDYKSSGKISFDRSINSRISEDLFDKMGGGKKPVSSIAVSEKDRNKEISEIENASHFEDLNRDAVNLLKDAKILEKAGVFSIVFEMVTSNVAKIITESVKVPTIGIGSGINCDGQVLVVHDMLGMFEKIKPKFAKRYLNLSEDIRNAINSYVKDVKEEKFPEEEHTFSMEKEELEKLEKEIG